SGQQFRALSPLVIVATPVAGVFPPPRLDGHGRALQENAQQCLLEVEMINCKNVLLLTALFCLSAALSFAHTSTSTLSGTVYDPSGAVIGGVDVTVTNDSTGVVFRQVTNEVGLYSFPAMAAGTYTITVEIPGFKTAKRTNVTLNVGIPAAQNFN